MYKIRSIVQQPVPTLSATVSPTNLIKFGNILESQSLSFIKVVKLQQIVLKYSSETGNVGMRIELEIFV